MYFRSLDCFTVLLVRHIADATFFVGLSTASGTRREIHAEWGAEREEEIDRIKGTESVGWIQWALDQMAAILQTTISARKAFNWAQ